MTGTSPVRLLVAALAAAAALTVAGWRTWQAVTRPAGGHEAPPALAGGDPVDADGRELPSVVIYLIDTLRADRLGAYGHGLPTSPRFDALAAESVLFEQCVAPAPWTLPSTVSLHTSTHPCEHGVLIVGQRISPALPTLAERLRSIGYRTASFHANPHVGVTSGLDRGFEVCERQGVLDVGAAAAWLDEQGADPFFLYAHAMEPHDPYTPSPQHRRHFAPVSRETEQAVNQLLRDLRAAANVDRHQGRPPGTTDTTREQTEASQRLLELRDAVEALYDGDVREADANLGRMIDALRERDLWDEVLFIVLGDHGEELGDRGGWLHGRSVHEENVHVPMLVRFPHGRHGGRRVQEVVTLVDVAPTILDFLGRPELAVGARGESLLEAATGTENRGDAQAVPRVASMRINKQSFHAPHAQQRGNVNVVIRQGRWKGIWNVEREAFELYDLRDDPGERDNVLLRDAEMERGRQMYLVARGWLDACQAESSEPVPVPDEPLDAAAMEELRALGYVQ